MYFLMIKGETLTCNADFDAMWATISAEYEALPKSVSVVHVLRTILYKSLTLSTEKERHRHGVMYKELWLLPAQLF